MSTSQRSWRTSGRLRAISEHIPSEILEEIIKKLPVKSLIRFRSVSKPWKSLIDSSKFIKNYHINRTHPHHHLFVSYKTDTERDLKFVSIADDDTFPQHMSPQTADWSFRILNHVRILGSSIGVICFYGDYKDGLRIFGEAAFLWNPSVRKSVRIHLPVVLSLRHDTVAGFGVCPITNDPKLVVIDITQRPTDHWKAEVFTLSSQAWKRLSVKPPPFYKSVHVPDCHPVSIEGFIYWHAYEDDFGLGHLVRSNLIISFNLTNEEFGQVDLPDSLVHSEHFKLAMRNECLTVLEYYKDGKKPVCGVWMMNDDGVNKSFTKMFTVKVRGKSVLDDRVFGFRKNGDAILETKNTKESTLLEVYDPCLGKCLRINELFNTISVTSYVETLLMLDQSESVIH